MEETVSSRLEPEMEQKTLHHCSANTLTVGDLGPGLPRSVRGGTGAREVRERLHRHPSTILPECLHPWDGRINHGWPSARLGPGSSPPPLSPPSTPSSPWTNMTNLVFIYLKRPGEKAKGGQIKKLYKINTELVAPALLLLFLVWAAEET